MNKIAIITDSNSGITQEQADKLGVFIIPMPVVVGEEIYYEGVNIGRNQFYEKLSQDINISTSQPSPTDVIQLWNDLLISYDEIVYIPMSSSLSGSYHTSVMLSNEFDGKVHVVNNQRISVSQRQSVLNALEMISVGMSALDIKETLEKDKYNSSIYDQDILNSLYSDKIIAIDEQKYNFNSRHYIFYKNKSKQNLKMERFLKEIVILHFSGRIKPWENNYRGNFQKIYSHYETLFNAQYA